MRPPGSLWTTAVLTSMLACDTATKELTPDLPDGPAVGLEISSADLSEHIESWYIPGELNVEQGTSFIVFWEVWCPHCQDHMPTLNETHEKLQDQGLKVVGLTRVSKSATEDQVTTFIEENELKYPIAKAQDEVWKMFQVAGVPSSVMIRDGKVVWQNHPARLTIPILEKWL